MTTEQQLRQQIQGLMSDLAGTALELRMAKSIDRQMELMLARTEIYKSIAHRQGLLIVMISQENKYWTNQAA